MCSQVVQVPRFLGLARAEVACSGSCSGGVSVHAVTKPDENRRVGLLRNGLAATFRNMTKKKPRNVWNRAQTDHDEKGNPYATPVAGWKPCEQCGADMPVRGEGRPPKFCSVACRVAHSRKTPRLF
jgi:hypothetical protein